MLGAAHSEVTTGYWAYWIQTTVALLAVSALAIVVLRLLRRRGSATRGLRIVARLAIDARRGLCIVNAAGKYLLIGLGDGPMTMLCELDGAEVAKLETSSETHTEPTALELIGRILGWGREREQDKVLEHDQEQERRPGGGAAK